MIDARWIDVGLVAPPVLHGAYAGLALTIAADPRPAVLWGRATGHLCVGQAQDPDRVRIGTLTVREREIVAITAGNAGATAKTIAQILFISEHTLRNHLTSIYNKLEVANRLELFAYAHKHGLIKRPE